MSFKGSTRRQMMARATAMGVTAMIAACGGGGGGSGGGGLPFIGGGNPQGGGNPPPKSLFTAEERGNLIDALCDKYGEFVDADPEKAMQALGEWARQQPHFNAVGVDRDTLWARFTDGRYFAFADNWKIVDPAELQAGKQLAQKAGDRAAEAAVPAQLAGKEEVPGSKTAVMLRLLAEEFSLEGAQSISLASKALTDRGWNVAPDHTLTVEALKGRGEIGLLYLNAHSSMLGPDDNRQFAVYTETRASDELDKQYEADLEDGSIVYTRSWTLWRQFRDRKRGPPYYAVTGSFFTKHVRFSSNSLVVLMMCNAGEAQSAELRAAINGSGASTIVAWDGSSNAYGFETVDMLFDRMTSAHATLGIGTYIEPNRAFYFDDVWRYLEKKGLLITPPASSKDLPSTVKRFYGGFDMTNPIITMLQAAWKDKLVIHGSFGSQPGQVSVGGTALNVAAWDANRLEVTLPTGTGDPAGSHGEVIVMARERKSNVKVLSSWRGTLSYFFEVMPGDNYTGVLSNRYDIDLHLRGDAHETRTEVDGALKGNTWNVIPASDTVVNYSATGRKTDKADPDNFEQWSGKGTLEFFGDQFDPSERKLALVARVNALMDRLEISLIAPASAPLVTVTRTGNPTQQRPLLVPIHMLGFVNKDGSLESHEPLVVGTYLPLDGVRNMPAFSQITDNPDDETHKLTITASAMAVHPPFNEEVGR